MHYTEDVATGVPDGTRLEISGRPREGYEERMVLAEEPGEPVQMHFRQVLVPHFKRDCPHCLPTDLPKPLWYIGAYTLRGEAVIAELTAKCFASAEAAARRLDLRGIHGLEEDQGAVFAGLLITVSRGNFPRSPRVLRCDQRVEIKVPWAYNTRLELARIWGVPVRPRLYRERS